MSRPCAAGADSAAPADALAHERDHLLATVDLDELLDRAAVFRLSPEEMAIVHRLAHLQHLLHLETAAASVRRAGPSRGSAGPHPS